MDVSSNRVKINPDMKGLDDNLPLSILVSVLENSSSVTDGADSSKSELPVLPPQLLKQQYQEPVQSQPLASKSQPVRAKVSKPGPSKRKACDHADSEQKPSKVASKGVQNENKLEKGEETARIVENPIPTEVVTAYATSLMRAFNEGKLPVLEAELNRICADDCTLRTQIFKTSEGAPFANRFVPRGRIFEYFCGLLESVPDGLYRPLNTKLIPNGRTRQVATNYRFSGTMVSAVYEQVIDSKFETSDPVAAAQLKETRTLGSYSLQAIGTFVMTLNSAYKVSSIEVMYRAKLEKL